MSGKRYVDNKGINGWAVYEKGNPAPVSGTFRTHSDAERQRIKMDEEASAEGCFVMMTLPVTIAVFAVINGVVFSKMWEWFVADTFEVQELSMVQAIGIALGVQFLTVKIDSRTDDKRDVFEVFGKLWLTKLITTAAFFVEAWIVSMFL